MLLKSLISSGLLFYFPKLKIRANIVLLENLYLACREYNRTVPIITLFERRDIKIQILKGEFGHKTIFCYILQ